jgi:hypothetical protein
MLQIDPWEYFKGQKFDINRWLGDGVDNDGDGFRDDATDASITSVNLGGSPPVTTELAFRGDEFGDANGDGNIDVPNMSLPPSFIGQTPHHTNGFPLYYDSSNNPVIVRNSYAARQLYARHLFCLAMLFLPDDQSQPDDLSHPNARFKPTVTFETDTSTRLNADVGRKLMIRRLAQWAINCVDFRDFDTIMTPFEYDENPWDGWNVDGYIGRNPGPDGILGTGDDVPSSDDTGSTRGLVWGLETPEVLITETLAFHDTGVKDTNQDNGTLHTYTDPSKNSSGATVDTTLDQFRMPKGSLFIELYRPGAKAWQGELTPPNNAYSSSKPYTQNTVELARGGGHGRPRWGS